MSSDLQLAPGLLLPPESVTETFAILANRGAGKSSTAHRFVEQLHKTGLPVIVIDVKGDWWGIRSSADGKSAGLPFVIFGGDHGDVPLEPTAGDLVADLVVDDRLSIVLDLSHMSKTKARSFATTFAERLYARNRDALHVVIEEADVLVPQRSSADTARLIGAMEDIAKRGRHRGLGLTVVSQRPQEVAKSVLDLMETVILLRMTGPRSIKAAQDWISVNAADDDSASLGVISSLPTLSTGEGWVWSPAFLQILQRVQFAKFETFDSHATPKPGVSRVVPKRRADVDLERLGAEIAATVERAKENDPRELRAQVQQLQRQLEIAPKVDPNVAAKDRELAALREEIAQLRASQQITVVSAHDPQLGRTLAAAADLITAARALVSADSHQAEADKNLVEARRRQALARAPVASTVPSPGKFRAGAQRMLFSLGRMAPLRLTKAQWGTVASMKHSSGTFSTYLGELRRAGLLDETHDGFTLSEAGFEFIGGRPAPMTGKELQEHYLTILRKGAARMLQSLMNVYPRALTRNELAEHAGIAVTSGTFSTYLGDLKRNGLIEQRGKAAFTASAIIMHGADTQSL